MRRYYKIFLALLYIMQLPIIFRESVIELYKSATETLHPQVETVQAPTPTLLKSAFKNGFIPTGEYEQHKIELDFFLLLGFALVEHHGDHHHLPHGGEEDNPKRMRGKRINEYLIANLYGMIRKFSPARQWSDGSRRMQRLILFGPAQV